MSVYLLRLLHIQAHHYTTYYRPLSILYLLRAPVYLTPYLSHQLQYTMPIVSLVSACACVVVCTSLYLLETVAVIRYHLLSFACTSYITAVPHTSALAYWSYASRRRPREAPYSASPLHLIRYRPSYSMPKTLTPTRTMHT